MGELFYWDEAVKKITNEEKIIIYGAGMMGKSLYQCLSEEPYNKNILGFLVSSKENNPSHVGQIPVMDLEEGLKYKDHFVLVALHEKNLVSALEVLKEKNFTNVLPITFDGDAWAHIRGNWIRNRKKEIKARYLDQVTERKCKIYVAYSERDRKLEEMISLRNFEQPIQVGAALTQQRIFNICDDMGENISEKNRKYCELTALYWMWKHDFSCYLGLSHYRRRFVITEEEISKLIHSDIDFVVTMPIVNFAGVKQQYSMDHDLSDWEIMMEVIHDIHPEYDQAAVKVENGNFYYGYNMFIARREVLDQYCRWLFAILQECEKRIGDKEDTYQNRYIGFLAERLLTVFIEQDKNLKVVIADKHFSEK